MEYLKYIFSLDNYINNLTDEIKSNKQKLYQHLIKTNISIYIDKEKVKNNFNSEIYNLEVPKSLIDNKYIFAQINSIRNVAISKEETKLKEYDNLDEVDDEENAIDDNKYLQGDEEKIAKTEKIYYKFEFTTTGEDSFFGFEYSQFSNEIHDKISSIKGPIFIKVLLGPKIEIRRGIFYLNNNNFQILS